MMKIRQTDDDADADNDDDDDDGYMDMDYCTNVKNYHDIVWSGNYCCLVTNDRQRFIVFKIY